MGLSSPPPKTHGKQICARPKICMIIIDESNLIALTKDEPSQLSKNELLLIKYLYGNQGTIISKDDLLYHCWPGKIVSPTSLPVAIKRIRDIFRKIEKDEAIKTHKGEGYSFVPGMITIKFINKEKKACTPHAIQRRRVYCIVVTLAYVVFFLFIAKMMFSGNIKSRNTRNGQLIMSLGNNIPAIKNHTTPGDIVFIDDTMSILICNHQNCTFIQ